jgi:hypothetical protein
MLELLSILELITDAGGHTSKPAIMRVHPAYRCGIFRRETQHLEYFEDQIDSKFCHRLDRIQSLTSQCVTLAILCR